MFCFLWLMLLIHKLFRSIFLNFQTYGDTLIYFLVLIFSIVSFLMTLLRYNSNRTQLTHLKCSNSMMFNMFTELCNHHHNFRTFCHSSRTPTRSYSPLHPHTPSIRQTPVLPVSVDWLILDIAHKWNHTICGSYVTSFFYLGWCFWGLSML